MEDHEKTKEQLLRELTELRRSRDQLVRLADNLHHSIVYQVTHDASGNRRFLYLSAAAERILGLKPEEVKADASMLYRQILEPFRPVVEQAEVTSAMNQLLFDVEVPVLVTDGTVKWLHIRSMPFRQEDGQMIWNGIATDVTDHKRAEEELRESEARYHSLFENTLDGFAYCQMLFDEHDHPQDFVYLAVNDAFGRLTGLENVIGKRATEVIAGIKEMAPELFETYGRVASTGNPERFEIDFKPLGLWLSVSVYSSEKGYFVAVFDNITDRKRAEEALRQSEERCRLLVETIPQLAWRMSPDGLEVDCNRRWYEYTGQTPAQVRGHGWLAAVHPDDLFRVVEHATHAAHTRQPYETEYRLRRASDGNYRWHLSRAIPMQDKDGQVICWFGSATDIEDLKQANDEELQRHRAELAHVARLSMMGEMVASLAHELNQPLHAVNSYACGSVRRLLKGHEKDQELVVALEQIIEETNRAAEIIRRVRGFVQKRKPQVSEVLVNDLVKEAVLLSKAELEQHHAKAVLALSEDLPAVIGDPIQIQQVLINLVRNALEAMDETPDDNRLVDIKTMRHGDDAVEVEVCDRGKGIDGEDLDKVFEPFFTTKPEGMGMGLAISRSIIQAREGRLWASANQNQGCTFHFTLPVSKGS